MEEPHYDSDSKLFKCVCNPTKDISFKSMTSYRLHCRSQCHLSWKAKKKGNDEIHPPLCSSCYTPMQEPIGHLAKCEWGLSPTQLQETWKELLHSKMKEIETCCICGISISVGKMCPKQTWKEQVYCRLCFLLHKQSIYVSHVQLLKLELLQDANYQCALCLKHISIQDNLILEHVNPHRKEMDPHVQLRNGEAQSWYIV